MDTEAFLLMPQVSLLHHKHIKNDQAMLF